MNLGELQPVQENIDRLDQWEFKALSGTAIMQ